MEKDSAFVSMAPAPYLCAGTVERFSKRLCLPVEKRLPGAVGAAVMGLKCRSPVDSRAALMES